MVKGTRGPTPPAISDPGRLLPEPGDDGSAAPKQQITLKQRNKRATSAAHRAITKASRELAPKEFSIGGLAYAARALTGGRAALMELARLSNHEAVKAVLKEWDSWSEHKRRKEKLELACESVGVDPAEFLSQIVKSAYEHNTDIAKLVAAVNMPRVVGATVKNALKEKGHRDREMLLKQSGLLPTPGGSQINVQAIAQAKNQAAVVVPTNGLPAFEDSMMAGMKAVRGSE